MINIHSIFDLQNSASYNYQRTYNNIEKWDKSTQTNCLEKNSRFSFAEDLVVYLITPETFCQEVDKYLRQMLRRFCKGNKQGYYELMIAVSVVSKLFYDTNKMEEYKYLNRWYVKLWYDDNFYKDYITDEEYMDIMRLR